MDNNTGDPPPKVKTPPSPKDGSSSAPGCDNIPENGTCEDGVASYCDIADGGSGSLRRKDCKALGKACIIDTARGAICEVVAPQAGAGEVICDSGADYEGACTGAGTTGTAVWCDQNTGQTMTYDCGAEGLECKTNDCAFGAFCCPPAGAPPPPPPSAECPAPPAVGLGFFGECGGPDNNTARWCDGTALQEEPCLPTEICSVDACADGAWCCPKPEAPVDECATIGIRGVCTPDGKPRWCSGGVVDEVTCAAGRTCQIDTCGNGAFCCAP